MARDTKLVVRLSVPMLERIRAQAENRGITMSALAAYVLGEWVIQQDRLVPLMEAIGEEAVKAAKEAAQEAVKGA